ncbi:hypothetical protein [Streptomyces sp. NPDC093149]|uniref:hypothetical protein n=1 Tax=Streptomyces sp. NPDC093149 TaxID=3366031 RepID=UPI0037FB8A31
MTPKSHKWKELPSDITAAHRALVTALREIRQCSPRTQAQIAKDAHQAATTLSNHLNGGRIPEEALLQGFYEVIAKEAAGGEPLPHTLDALLELRIHAQKKHCDCCSVGYPSAGEEGKRPASRAVRISRVQRQALRLRRLTRRRDLSMPQTRIRVPVPRAEGDRHPSEAAEVTWTETAVVARYLSDGRNRDADLLLWRAGTSYSADNILKAVASCRAAGLPDAAEAILISAAERTDKRAVMSITAAFNHAGRHEDVAVLLAAAVRASD